MAPLPRPCLEGYSVYANLKSFQWTRFANPRSPHLNVVPLNQHHCANHGPRRRDRWKPSPNSHVQKLHKNKPTNSGKNIDHLLFLFLPLLKRKELSLIIFEKRHLDKCLVWAKSIRPSTPFTHHLWYIINLRMKTDREVMLHKSLELLNHWLMSLLQCIGRWQILSTP